jgi:hypothetical protein
LIANSACNTDREPLVLAFGIVKHIQGRRDFDASARYDAKNHHHPKVYSRLACSTNVLSMLRKYVVQVAAAAVAGGAENHIVVSLF